MTDIVERLLLLAAYRNDDLNIFKEAADEIESLRQQIVTTFNGDEIPTFRQGIPEHALESVVTAEQCTYLVNKLTKARQRVQELEEEKEAAGELEFLRAELSGYIKELEEKLDRANNTCENYKFEWDAAVNELAALKAGQGEPFAWATFDGEGGYDLRLYEDNEDYMEQFISRNGKRYASWVLPLYTSAPSIPEGWQWQHVAATTLARFIHHGAPFDGDEKWAEIADVAIKLLNEPYAAAPKQEKKGD